MEIKINKEIRNYSESVFFGLSLRQSIFSVLACIVAVITYFGLKDILHKEIVSWLCILFASPFAGMGFVTYHGMNFEEFVYAWIKYQFLVPKRLLFLPDNTYYEILKPSIKKYMKEVYKNNE